MVEIRNVVLATDLSDSSARATEVLRALWPRLDGELTLLHVAPDSGFAVPAPTPEEEAQVLAEKESALRRLAEDFGGECKTLLLRGDPSRRIAEYVNDRGDVDLLVLGRHYYSRLQRLLTGVVADIISKEVKCPVLRC